MQLPYVTHCYRTTVLARAPGGDAHPSPEEESGDDTGVTLIDLR